MRAAGDAEATGSLLPPWRHRSAIRSLTSPDPAGTTRNARDRARAAPC
jgi:hypothetical protein